MLKILISLLFLFSFHAAAMSESFLRMKPNQAYMSFALTHYIKWHKANFDSSFSSMENKSHGFIRDLISRIDHWLVQERPEFLQFSIGHSLSKENRVTHSFRVFIHPELRSHNYLKKLRTSQNFVPWFFEWNDEGGLCLLGKRKSDDSLTFSRFCKAMEGNNLIFTNQEIISSDLTSPWPSPFLNLNNWEIRTVKDGLTESIDYHSSSTHPSKIPRALDQVINLHSIEALFPFDKFKIQKDGSMTIYYP